MVLTFLQQKNCNIFDTTIEIAYTFFMKKVETVCAYGHLSGNGNPFLKGLFSVTFFAHKKGGKEWKQRGKRRCLM